MNLANSQNQPVSFERENRHFKQVSQYAQSMIEEGMKESVSTRRHSVQQKSTDNLSIAKWESRVLELQRKLDTQTYQIETMRAEGEHFMRVCEEQKE